MYAIIETGGKQYKVSANDVIYVEKLDNEANAEVNFNVVAMGVKNELQIGSPLLKDAKVTGEVLKNGKAKKIIVFTYKAKKGEKRKLGHRQPYTKILIKELSFKDIVEKAEVEEISKKKELKKAKAETKKTEKKKTEKVVAEKKTAGKETK
jgi:large subunit ribosomal protein L21